MNITVTKIKRILEKEYGWELNDSEATNMLIKDTLSIINEELIKHKNISIKKGKKI